MDMVTNDDQDTGQEIETSKKILDSVLKKGRRKHSESTGDNDHQEEDSRFITTNKHFRKVQEEIPRNKRNHHLKNLEDDDDAHVHSSPNKKMVRFDPTSEEHNRKYAIGDGDNQVISKKKSAGGGGEDKKKKAEVVVEKPFYKVAQNLKDRFTFSSPSTTDVSSTPIHFFSTITSTEAQKDDDDGDDDGKKIKVQKDSQVVNFFAKSFGVGESNFFFLQEDDKNFAKLFKPVEEYFLENTRQGDDGGGGADNYYERKLIKKMAKGKVKNFQVKSKKNFRRWKTSQANNKNKNNNNNKKRIN